MDTIQERIQSRLFAMQDLDYKQFHTKLVPTVDADTIIGVRTPELRKFAKELSKDVQIQAFISHLPHEFYEENNLHGFLIELNKDYDTVLRMLTDFLPYVDNWGTCDLVSPKIFQKHLPDLYGHIQRWIASTHTYTVRFGLGMLLRFYLDDAFDPAVLTLAANVQTDEYYIKMMVAWFFATALAKQYAAAIVFLEERRLEKWTHNKAIQKAIESRRISTENKLYLRSLKIK